MAEYPARRNHFAHKLVRIMLRACAMQEIGTDGFALVTAISHTEDAKHYSGAVTFWNDQLMSIMGFSRGQLDRARAKAIEHGWLYYEPGGKGKVGRYWSLLPERVSALGDNAVDCDAAFIMSKNAQDSAQDNAQDKVIPSKNAQDSAQPSARETGENRAAFIPSPIPSPIPNTNTPPNPQGGTEVASTNGKHRTPRAAKASYRVEDQVYPPTIDTDAFRAAWQTWTLHRQEIGHPMTPTAAAKTLAKCAAWGPSRAIAAIDHSAGNGWRGLFEPDPAKMNGHASGGYGNKTFNGQPDPRGNFAVAAAYLEKLKLEEQADGEG